MTTQEEYIGITTPFGTDKLTLTNIHADESISSLFSYSLALMSEDQALAPTGIIGKPVDFWIILRDGSKRNFNGYVSQFISGSLRTNGLRSYQAIVAPWFWFLTKTCDHKIFQSKTAIEIIEEVFNFYGFTDYQINVTKTCPLRDYCVQYGESAFDFVSRLMEEEGIFYFFTHEQGKHTMVLTDNTSSFTNCAENELIYLNIAAEQLHSWTHNHAYITGKVSGNNYAFETPELDLKSEVSTVVDLENADAYERYEYPYTYRTKSDGEPFVRSRIEAEELQYHTVESSGTYRSLQVGGKFKISDHECADEIGKEYTIISLHFETNEEVSSNDADSRSYFNQFTCIPATTKPKQKCITPRPKIVGMQTAVVVGPSGEEIYTDKYGRVKVQFHWDRLGEKDENSSCWIRVSQSWAGKAWGGIIIPRIGQEVVVSFLDGNPDNPLITGQVYNATNMPPYTLPANQTQSGFKTRSTKDGSATTFNELRFEDKKGKEEIYIHAQQDFNIDINHNYNTTIDEGDDTYLLKKGNVSETLTEGSMTSVLTKGDKSLELSEGNHNILLTKGDEEKTLSAGNQTLTLESGNREINLKSGNQEISLDSGDYKIALASGDMSTKLDGGKISLEASTKIENKVGGNSSTIDTSKIELKVGSNSIKIESAGITLTCGGNSIKMDPSGVTVKGTMVKIDASAMAEVKGGAMVKVKGGITMIN